MRNFKKNILSIALLLSVGMPVNALEANQGVQSFPDQCFNILVKNFESVDPLAIVHPWDNHYACELIGNAYGLSCIDRLSRKYGDTVQLETLRTCGYFSDARGVRALEEYVKKNDVLDSISVTDKSFHGKLDLLILTFSQINDDEELACVQKKVNSPPEGNATDVYYFLECIPEEKANEFLKYELVAPSSTSGYDMGVAITNWALDQLHPRSN